MVNKDELNEEAVDVCLDAWKALRQGPDIDASEPYGAFMDSLVKKIQHKEVSHLDGRIPLLLCVITGLATNEELTDLESVLNTASNSLVMIEKCRLNENDKAALRSIVADVIDRNFPTDVINSPDQIIYDETCLQSYIRRYVDGYKNIRLGAL